jgi:Reverse transcriptase (RNA-dependent DNA polymerase)
LEQVKDQDETTKNLAYMASLYTCHDTGFENISDPRMYAAKHRMNNPDMPNFNQALNGEHAEEWVRAMILEVDTLMQQRTWTTVPRSNALNVLKGTWVFKLKRLPDGTPLKFKAPFCARGVLQKEGVDYFETYAPVVQWSTIRLLLSTVLTEGWCTRQVDYTNAFAQAEINEEVYLEHPRMFGPKSGKDVVLKLLKSLYGLKQAPRTFFEKLRAGLLERGYSQSIVDPCLFLKKGIMCVVYVDDTIFAGADSSLLEAEVAALGVSDSTQRHQFHLRNEGEVGAFLGIQITKTGPGEFFLCQPGLISKALTVAGMSDSNGVDTPTSTKGGALAADLDGAPFDETWSYRTVIGMLMFLSANTRPDIAFAVHQAARFSHSPRASHSLAVKRILRYLKKTQDQGFYLRPNSSQTVDCYVDADFAGNFSAELPDNPESVKSRTGYLILYRGSPLLWVSKLQSLIALSTMEAEYVALSQSMRDLIPIRELLKEVLSIVFSVPDTIRYQTHSKAFNDVSSPRSSIPASKVYEDNAACLKFASTGQLSPRTKHIGVPYHWFRSKVVSLDIQILPVSTTDQLADIFTKGLPNPTFESLRRILMGW